jgi:hypothetical protein
MIMEKESGFEVYEHLIRGSAPNPDSKATLFHWAIAAGLRNTGLSATDAGWDIPIRAETQCLCCSHGPVK